MTEEVKEILDDMKSIPSDEICGLGLGEKQCKLLLNYITNLQKENKHLDKVNCKLRKKINNDIYKQRNEKAVELIKKALIESDITGNGTLNLSNLLNILQGGDE